MIVYYGENYVGNKKGDIVQVKEWFAINFR